MLNQVSIDDHRNPLARSGAGARLALAAGPTLRGRWTGIPPRASTPAAAPFDPDILLTSASPPPAPLPRLAVVLGMSETGLGTIRLLGRRGVCCWGVDAPLDLPGFRSRYCARRIHVPGQLEAAELAAILRHAGIGTGERPVVIPTADHFVKLLSDARDALTDRFDMALPPRAVVDDLLDKRRFADLAARVGLRVPRTAHLPELAAIEEVARSVGFPVVVKPRLPADRDRTSFPKAVVLRSEQDARDLAKAWRSARAVPDLVVQEYVPGGDRSHVSVAAALDASSRPVALFVSKKRRQGNHGAGVGTFVESHRDGEAARVACRLLQRIGYVGVAEMEMKRHEDTGELFAIEVNPRLWSQVTLPAALGVDFVLSYCQIATGGPPGALIEPGPRPCAWQDLWSDLYWTFRRGGYWHNGEVTLLDWLRQTLTARAHPYFAWNDPVPALRRAWENVARAARTERAAP